MAKASNTSDRNSRENSMAITERPCVTGCGGTLGIVVVARGWKSKWLCSKCGHEMNKTKGDYPLSEALRLKALIAKVDECKKALKKVPEGDENAAIAADAELGMWQNELDVQTFKVKPPFGYVRLSI